MTSPCERMSQARAIDRLGTRLANGADYRAMPIQTGRRGFPLEGDPHLHADCRHRRQVHRLARQRPQRRCARVGVESQLHAELGCRVNVVRDDAAIHAADALAAVLLTRGVCIPSLCRANGALAKAIGRSGLVAANRRSSAMNAITEGGHRRLCADAQPP